MTAHAAQFRPDDPIQLAEARGIRDPRLDPCGGPPIGPGSPIPPVGADALDDVDRATCDLIAARVAELVCSRMAPGMTSGILAPGALNDLRSCLSSAGGCWSFDTFYPIGLNSLRWSGEIDCRGPGQIRVRLLVNERQVWSAELREQ